MSEFDSVLKMYAENGLRSVADWCTRGRDIASGMKPRCDAPHRGALLSLYTRDQTQPRPRSEHKRI
jgi:sugar diacid utilization regulator